MTSFATLADFAALYQLDEEDLAADTVDLLLELASGLVRDHVGQQLAPVTTDDVIELNGRGHAILQLPELPVTAVGEVTETVAGTTTTLVEGTDYRVELGRHGRIGQLHRIDGRWHPRGVVSVTYSHGYTLPASDAIAGALPQAVRTVTLRVVARSYSNPEEHRQESAGGSSVTFASDRPGLYLTAADKESLGVVMPGGRGGAR